MIAARANSSGNTAEHEYTERMIRKGIAMSIAKKTYYTLFLILSLALAGCSTLSDKRFYQSGGIALEGYDPVAYFTTGEATPGKASINLEHAGSTWHFASAAHREQFQREPERYLPQYGGYCAYAMNYGFVVSSDPRAFTLVDDKLYLNYSFSVRDKWLKSTAEYIERADRNWERRLAQSAQ